MRGPDIRGRKGVVMITAYIVVAALSILAIASVSIATTEYNFARRYFASSKAFYLAEGGLDQVAFELANMAADPSTVEPDAGTTWDDLTVTDNNFLSSGFSLSTECVAVDSDHQSPTTPSREKNYQLSATVTDPDTGLSRTVNQILARRKYYVFQYAVFYADDLEILPGSNMTLSGNIHCNADIYMATGATLTIDANYLFSAGDIFNMRKNNLQESSGNVRIKVFGTENFANMREGGDEYPLDSRRSDWPTASQVRWAGTVKSGVHGINSFAAPSSDFIAPDGYYAQNADVKVLNGNVYLGGSELAEGVDMPVGTIGTTSTFYNYRERTYIKMTELDLRKLAGWEPQLDEGGNPVLTPEGDPVYVQNYPNHLPANGLIYATRNDVGSGEQPGVRLLNGSGIDRAGGITVVMDVPAYVQGDFNTGDTLDIPDGGTVTMSKQSVAVIADALNIVSNNWSDANSAGGLSDRPATDTTVNAAFLAGAGKTIGSSYGGGFENYPRLHENWGGKTLVLRGSFTAFWDSEVGTGPWSRSSYRAPTRNWDFDPDFNDLASLPVFTPYFVQVVRSASWEGETEELAGEIEL